MQYCLITIVSLILWLFSPNTLASNLSSNLPANTSANNKLQSSTKLPQTTFFQKLISSAAATTGTPESIFDHNLLHRSEMGISQIGKVDPFTGGLRVSLPLLHVPGNDGLSLDFTLIHQDMPQNLYGFITNSDNTVKSPLTSVRSTPIGFHWYAFTGIISSMPDMRLSRSSDHQELANPIFIDPNGDAHELFPDLSAANMWNSKDNWRASLTSRTKDNNRFYSGTVTNPQGVKYYVEAAIDGVSPVYTITSPRGRSGIVYKYDSLFRLASIRFNTDYEVKFNYQTTISNQTMLSSIETSDKKTWRFTHGKIDLPSDPEGFERFPIAYTHPNTLTSVILPDERSWEFSYQALPAFVSAITQIKNPLGGISKYEYNYHYTHPNAENFGDRLSDAYVISETQSGPNLATTTLRYTYDRGPWGETFPPYYVKGRTRFGTSTRVESDTSVIQYTFNDEADPVGFLGEIDEVLRVVIYPIKTPKTGLLEKKEIFSKSNGALTLMQVEDYKYDQRKISNQPGFIYYRGDGLAEHSPYDPNSGVFAPLLIEKTITRGTDHYQTLYSNFDKYGCPGKIEEIGDKQKSRVSILTYQHSNSPYRIGLLATKSIEGVGLVEKNTYRTKTKDLITSERSGSTSRFSYANGLLTEVSDGMNHSTKYSDYYRGLPRSELHSKLITIARQINPDGSISSSTDGAGHITKFEYDLMGRPVKITPGTGTPWTYQYDKNGTTTLTRGNYSETTQVDSIGRPILIELHDGQQNKVRRQVIRYDNDGLEDFRSYWFEGSTSNVGTYKKYDALGRVTWEWQGTASDTSRGTHFQYLPGHQVEITDALSHVTKKTFESYSDPDQAALIEETQPEGVATTFVRNAIGMVLSASQGGMTRQYVYDANFNLVKASNPESGDTTFEYNAAHQVTKKTDSSGAYSQFTYDDLNRLTDVTYSDSSPSLSIGYDNDNNVVEQHKGQVINHYQYGDHHQLTNETLEVDGKSYPLAYQYDELDHLSEITYPNGKTISYAPNAFGDATIAGDYVSHISYFANGVINKIEFGNHIVSEQTLNNYFLPDKISLVTEGKTLGRRYEYDGLNNITSLTDLADTAFNIHMQYDGINRLITADGSWGHGEYQYDVMGNITHKLQGDRNLSYVYDTQNRLASVNGWANRQYQYDSVGNVTQDDKHQFVYTADGDLQQIKDADGSIHAQYTYDANHHRVKSDISGKLTYSIFNRAGLLTFEEDYANAIAKLNIYLGKQKQVQLNYPIAGALAAPTTNTIYLHHDVLGSPIAATDSAGKLLWQQHYMPYGELVEDPKSEHHNTQWYTGKQWDQDTGLYYYGLRYYDPLIGRFLAVDPDPFKPESPITFNRYAYASDNPYRYVDPNGAFALDWINSIVSSCMQGIDHGASLGLFNYNWDGNYTYRLCFTGAGATTLATFGSNLAAGKIIPTGYRLTMMLEKNEGFNISPEGWFDKFPTLGRTETYVTDFKAVADVLGNVKPNTKFNVGLISRGNTVSYYKTWQLEKNLGLESGSLTQAGFRFNKISDIMDLHPRSPVVGNQYFKGGGMGLPGGGPELAIDPVPTSLWP